MSLFVITDAVIFNGWTDVRAAKDYLKCFDLLNCPNPYFQYFYFHLFEKNSTFLLFSFDLFPDCYILKISFKQELRVDNHSSIH